MNIEVAQVRRQPQTYVGEESPEAMDLAHEEDLRVAGPLRYALRAYVASGELIVNGAVEVEVDFQCCRCGEVFRRTVREGSFQAVFEVPRGDECVDLTPPLRESIILDFPSHPTCSPDCRGVCVRCGRNRNEGECGCEPPASGTWSVLEGLKSPE